MSEDLVRVSHLKKYFTTHYGVLHAVDDVSFGIARGETLGLVGESGCGKSTIGRLILRLIEPTSGNIFFGDTSVTSLKKRQMRAMRRKMQIVFQDPYASLDSRKTVFESIGEPLRVQKKIYDKKSYERRVYDLMELSGIDYRLANAYPHELDGGRRQRVGIARALALNPEFIVLDEPVSALDVSIQAQVLNLLEELQKNFGLTYLFISHDMGVIKHVSTTVAVMYLGQIVEKGPAHELFHAPLHPYTQALLSAVPVPSIDVCTKRIILKGEVPSPVNPVPGCRFAGRCMVSFERCTVDTPPLCEVRPQRFVACHRVSPKK